MKIAVLGSAPSSINKAPFGDPSWGIWSCSPGAYPNLARVDAHWEIHRWEPGVIGKAATQKPWFTPEYVMWLKSVPPVLWVADPDALKDCPNAKMLPVQQLIAKYGHYVWTSSVAYMLAMAIDKIQEARAKGDDSEHTIGLWGVDMAANEELYTSQRASCQFFIQVIVGLGIKVLIPPESDLATPPPMYGVSEISHKAIKLLERRRELDARLAQANAAADGYRTQSMFIQGAIDDLDYIQKMWMHEGEDTVAFNFEAVFPALVTGNQVDQARKDAVKALTSAMSAAKPAAEPLAPVKKVAKKRPAKRKPARSKKRR